MKIAIILLTYLNIKEYRIKHKSLNTSYFRPSYWSYWMELTIIFVNDILYHNLSSSCKQRQDKISNFRQKRVNHHRIEIILKMHYDAVSDNCAQSDTHCNPKILSPLYSANSNVHIQIQLLVHLHVLSSPLKCHGPVNWIGLNCSIVLSFYMS